VGTLRVLWGLGFLGSLLALGGCSWLPASGPGNMNIRQGQQDPHSLPYAFVRVTPKVTDVLATAAPRLGTTFTDRRPPKDIRFGVGDIVSVTIFEAAAGGLFIPSEAGVRPGNFITIPNQAIDIHGNISVPYAGTIRARGRTQVEVQQAIVDALKNRAIEPQVVVSTTDQKTSQINILGDVLRPSRIPANLAGERILDTITRAGGPSAPGSDTWVMLEREGRRALSPFGALVYEPSNNIWTHPDDTIYLYREPQTFLAFGAFSTTGGGSTQGQIPFGAWRLTLAEAVARAGGLGDAIADPASVFLYRGETREVAEQMGIDCSRFQGPIIPVIYNMNFRDPAVYFLATSFEMRNKDVIYITNSFSTELYKFLTLIDRINTTVNDPIQTAIAAYTLRSVAKGTAQPAVLVGAPTVTSTAR
jgi:polysaccharide biosynthesis/export protein